MFHWAHTIFNRWSPLLLGAAMLSSTMHAKTLDSASPTLCGDWSQFALSPNTDNDQEVMGLFDKFVTDYSVDNPDDGCLMGEALALADRIFINPESPIYERILQRIESRRAVLETLWDSGRRLDAISQLTQILQERWTYRYIDIFSRSGSSKDLYYVGGSAAMIGAAMALSYAFNFSAGKTMTATLLQKFTGFYRDMDGLTLALGLGGGVAGNLQSQKKRNMGGANPLAFADLPSTYVRPPFEIISISGGSLKANYSHAEGMRTLQSAIGGGLVTFALGYTPKTILFTRRFTAALTAQLQTVAAEARGWSTLAAAWEESQAAKVAGELITPGGWWGLGMKAAIMGISFEASKWVGDAAQARFVQQFKDAYQENREKFRTAKNATDWDRFYLGSKLVTAEREWSAWEDTPAIFDLNKEIAHFNFYMICPLLSTREPQSKEIAEWPRRVLSKDGDGQILRNRMIEEFRGNLKQIQAKYHQTLTASFEGFQHVENRLNEINVPHKDILLKEMGPGRQATTNLLHLSDFTDEFTHDVQQDVAVVQNLMSQLESVDTSPDTRRQALTSLQGMASQYGCYASPISNP